MSQWIIEADEVGKTFSWTPVLEQVSCRIGAGEAVGFFGPNGAGKTTLLRLFATLLRPSTGKLSLFGRAPYDPVVRRQLGFVGHESFLYPDLTPVENLTFYGRAYGLANLHERIAAALQQAGLHDYMSMPVRAFSRGMEQRLALARALLHEPALLLLDEPYTGLDAEGLKILAMQLRGAKSQGKTLVLTTHDFAQGLAACDRAFILNRGRIVWESGDRLPSLPDFLEIYHIHSQNSGLRILDSWL
jgi:heme exporter protein A